MVGIILIFIAIMMVFPLVIALLYKDGDSIPFLWSIFITVAVGSILFLQKRGGKDINLKGGFAVVTFGWLAMGFAGALPFYLTGSIPSFIDCLFESMSGFTTTGASILGSEILIESLPHGVLFWRSLTHWIGGMGIIVLSLAVMPLLGVGGMQMYKAEFPGPVKDKLTPRIRDTAEILWGVYLLISLAEFILLSLGGMTFFDAACHTFGTMATGGFSTHGASIAYFESRYIHYVIIVFMIIAGINFNYHFLLLRGKTKQYWMSREFRFYIYIIASFTVFVLINNLIRGEFTSFEEGFRQSLFHVVALITTTGFGAADWESWGSFLLVLMVVLMFIGGMAGSTGGGMKVMRIQIALKQIWTELKRLIHPHAIIPIRLGKEIVDESITRNVITFILAFVLILIFSTALLTAMGIDLVTSSGAAIACLSNIGPGLGEVGAVDNYGHLPNVAKILLTFLMVLGRLEIFTVLVMLSSRFWRK